jgi:diaminohydroxyphosphoribosylaminopyrimidine deaminase/5-amino-6-(5-phosphoribosylamino)uracil reductase
MRAALDTAVHDDAPRGVNPRVGCLLVKDSRVIGIGQHRGAGTPHAEIEALSSCSESPAGATAVVTLEPCAHTGRTGPCADALIESGITRVVFAMADPTPAASGGAHRLRSAGVEVIDGVLLREAESINADWSFMKLHGRPHVTLKLAGSLDGKVDSALAERLILTGPDAQSSVHRLRAQVDAIAVGSGTVLTDDPQLSVRGIEVISQPARVILGLSPIPEGARIRGGESQMLVIGEKDPRLALAHLAELGIQRLLLEGGPTVASAYLEAGVIDEVQWFVAPILVGSGKAALSGLSCSITLDVTSVDLMGEDVRIIGVPASRGA